MSSVAKRLSLPILLLLAPPLCAASVQEVDLGATANPERFGESRRSLALLADGGYAAIWTEETSTAVQIRMQWVRSDGSQVFADGGIAVGDAASTAPFPAVVAADPQGGAFVAYSRPQKSQALIYVQSYDAAGDARWSSGGVLAASLDARGYAREPQLAAAPGGGVFVCFSSADDVVCQRLGSDGERLWTGSGVTAGGQPGAKEIPRMVPDGGDGLLVFWRNSHYSFGQPGNHVLIEGQHLSAEGVSGWGPQGKILRETNLPAGSSYSDNALSAVPDGHRGAVLSFEDWNGRGKVSRDTFAQRVTGVGRLLWGNGVAVAAGSAYQAPDSATATGDGGAFITVWVPSSGLDQLWLYRLGSDGRTVWKQRLFIGNPQAPASDWEAYGAFDGSRLRIAWSHYTRDGASTVDAYLAVFDLAGHRLNGPAGTPLTQAPGHQHVRGFVFDPARKQGFAVWIDSHKTDSLDLDTMGALYRE